jgi:hypothetical protein
MLFCSELLLQRKELGYLSWSCYLGLVLGSLHPKYLFIWDDQLHSVLRFVEWSISLVLACLQCTKDADTTV